MQFLFKQFSTLYSLQSQQTYKLYVDNKAEVTNVRIKADCVLAAAAHYSRRSSHAFVTRTQRITHLFIYLHIYLSTYLYPGGRGGVLANAGDPARVRALLPQLHPVPVQDGGLPVGLQPEHPPHPRPGGTNIKFYQYKTKIFSV